MFSEEDLTLQIPHNHDPTPGEADAMDVKTGIKRKATQQTLTPAQKIIADLRYFSKMHTPGQ